MKVLDLFSGIGGFSLAAHWMGWETVQFVEIDRFCQAVLRKNFPNVPIHDDIRTFNRSTLSGEIDIVVGGFPCQPLSIAGKRRGKNDDRWLWDEMYRVSNEVKPTFIVAENVSGVYKYLDEICTSLESIGYETEPVNITASSIGADHIRERYWIIAHSISSGYEGGLSVRKEKEYSTLGNVFEDEARYTTQYENEIESMRLGTYNGIPLTLDRIKSLGNSIVPQVAFEIFKAIDKL